jgi:hypothetical protein
VTEPKTTDVERLFNYRDIKSVKDYLAAAQISLADIPAAADVLGEGFVELRQLEKRRLVGVPLLFLDWKFVDSDKFATGGEANEFVYVKILTMDDRKYAIVDGSAGIARQLREYTDWSNTTGPLMVHKGLTESQYETEDTKGNKIQASTFYVDLAAPSMV